MPCDYKESRRKVQARKGSMKFTERRQRLREWRGGRTGSRELKKATLGTGGKIP